MRGEPAFAPTSPVTLLNPRVVIEVLSETTEEYDRGAKVAHYRHRASVDLILLIDSQRRTVERQQRNQDGTWTLSEHTSGMVIVLEHEIPLDELYDGVALAADPQLYTAAAERSGGTHGTGAVLQEPWIPSRNPRLRSGDEGRRTRT